jgi:hypothetical protein
MLDIDCREPPAAPLGVQIHYGAFTDRGRLPIGQA